MNSHDWHRQALTTTTTPLTPIPVRQFEALSQQDQDEHWNKLIRWMASHPLEGPLLREVTGRIETELARNGHAPYGAKTIIGLSAANGVGKSTLVKRMAHRIYRETVHTEPPPSFGPDVL